MSNLTRSVQKSLWISKAWLTEKAHDKNAYVDMRELARREGAYYVWFKAKHGEKDADVEAVAANMTFTGIRVNDGTNCWVNCQFDSDKEPHRRYFVPGLTHPNSVRRVYAHRTTVRGGLEIVGVAGAVA